jgi:hypothetical protein
MYVANYYLQLEWGKVSTEFFFLTRLTSTYPLRNSVTRVSYLNSTVILSPHSFQS